MGKQTEGCDDFKKYINGPTKKDPRQSGSYDHDKAFEEIKAKGGKSKAKTIAKKDF